MSPAQLKAMLDAAEGGAWETRIIVTMRKAAPALVALWEAAIAKDRAIFDVRYNDACYVFSAALRRLEELK